jgi:hypothetical protein
VTTVNDSAAALLLLDALHFLLMERALQPVELIIVSWFGIALSFVNRFLPRSNQMSMLLLHDRVMLGMLHRLPMRFVNPLLILTAIIDPLQHPSPKHSQNGQLLPLVLSLLVVMIIIVKGALPFRRLKKT